MAPSSLGLTFGPREGRCQTAFLAVAEDLTEDARGVYCVRPACVERQVGDQALQLFLGHAVGDGAVEVTLHLFRAIQRNQRRAPNQAAVALAEVGALPDLAE